jgi:hypothetical protein
MNIFHVVLLALLISPMVSTGEEENEKMAILNKWKLSVFEAGIVREGEAGIIGPSLGGQIEIYGLNRSQKIYEICHDKKILKQILEWEKKSYWGAEYLMDFALLKNDVFDKMQVPRKEKVRVLEGVISSPVRSKARFQRLKDAAKKGGVNFGGVMSRRN